MTTQVVFLDAATMADTDLSPLQLADIHLTLYPQTSAEQLLNHTSGAQVLISNKVNIWREIETHEAGIVRDDTLEGTEQMLQRWLELSDSEKQQMTLRARNIFTERFEIGRAAEDLISIIQRK